MHMTIEVSLSMASCVGQSNMDGSRVVRVLHTQPHRTRSKTTSRMSRRVVLFSAVVLLAVFAPTIAAVPDKNVEPPTRKTVGENRSPTHLSPNNASMSSTSSVDSSSSGSFADDHASHPWREPEVGDAEDAQHDGNDCGAGSLASSSSSSSSFSPCGAHHEDDMLEGDSDSDSDSSDPDTSSAPPESAVAGNNLPSSTEQNRDASKETTHRIPQTVDTTPSTRSQATNAPATAFSATSGTKSWNSFSAVDSTSAATVGAVDDPIVTTTTESATLLGTLSSSSSSSSSSSAGVAANEEGVLSAASGSLAVASLYRSTFCRCQASECQNEYPGAAGSNTCTAQLGDGTCPIGFSKCVASSSYKVQVSRTTPHSVADVTFSLLASDIAGALQNLGDQSPTLRNTKWWVAFRLPAGWRFVAWARTTVVVELTHNGVTTTKQLQVHPCRQVTDESNCRAAASGSTEIDDVGFVAIKDMASDWRALASASAAPLVFRLEKSVVSGSSTATESGTVGVFIVYETTSSASPQRRQLTRQQGMRELYVSAASAATGDTNADSGVGVAGNLSSISLAKMDTPTIAAGRLYSSMLWIEVEKEKATLSFSTSTIIGRNSNNPKVCVNLRPTACMRRGRVTAANISFVGSASASYVKDGNPFLNLYAVAGDALLTVERVNDTFFCVDKLLPTGVSINKTWEINSDFTFQLYVQGLVWSTNKHNTTTSPTDTSIVPILAEILLIDRGAVQGSECSQLIVHEQPSTNHGLSVYSVMSVTIYAVAFVGAVLITRMNGITFSTATFYNDMTSVCVVIVFLLSIVGNAIWINVSADATTTNASQVYYLTRILTMCFAWTMMTSVCFHWSTVLNHDVRKIRRVYLMFTFMAINAAFYACGVFTLISMSDFFKCAYDDYLKNPKYDKRMCDTDYCPDLQPYQWRYAAHQLCKTVSYSHWYFAMTFLSELFMFLASVALLVLGTYVLQRGSRLIEHTGNLVDDRVVTVMRNSLKTYLIVILAITLSLGVSTTINVVLYCGNWPMNAIVWYTFTVWLPTLIPPAGFLVLQWNPRLHGISMSHHASGAANTNAPKSRRDTKDEDMKRALGRQNSTLGLLSDGWSGITDFPDTDYRPIGAGTNQGCQQLLTLSVQLVTPVSISHACYMELYVGEPDGSDGATDDFSFGVPGRPLGSISSMIQSGLLRESMIVQDRRRGTNTTLLNSMITTNTSWVRVGLTETVLPILIHSNDGSAITQVATFMSTLQVPAVSASSMLRFVVYEIPESSDNSPVSSTASDTITGAVSDTIHRTSIHMDERAVRARVSGLGIAPSSRPRVFCEFTCSSIEFVNTDQVRLVAPEGSHRAGQMMTTSNTAILGDTDDDVQGSIGRPVLRVRSTTVSTRTLKESSGFYTTKCFQFADGDEMVVEDMTESIFTNEIPRQFLDLLQKERANDLARAEQDLHLFEEKCKRGLAAGLYDNLIDQIQGENVQAVAQSWLEERVRQRSTYIDALKECQQLCGRRAEEGVNFKASTEKKSMQLRFLPINLHIQDMWVGPTSDLRCQLSRRTSDQVKLYTGVTVGAFAAHGFKFRHGAGILSMRSRLVKKAPLRSASDRLLLARNDSGLSDRSQEQHELDWTEADVRAEEELKWQIVTRMDMCLSQALTAVIASFCRNLEAALQHPQGSHFLHVVDSVGFLWQVESLLSTQGKELGMLEDFYAAVEAMRGVTFVLDTSPPSHLPPTLNLHIKDVNLPSVVSARINGDTKSGSYTVVVGVRCHGDVLETIPAKMRAGAKIPVTAVLFTQGINEMQTLANSSSGKKTTLQQTINRDSFLVLQEHVDKFKRVAAQSPNIITTDLFLVSTLLAELEERIMSACKQMVKTKHPKIIQQSSRLCRLLSGGRVTSCKSAKDRTGMSVTLEQGQLLCDHHGLPAEFLVRTVSTMRSNGVRLENAFKNTGKRQYAFNGLQRSLLPDEYKCPEGTYGRGNVS